MTQAEAADADERRPWLPDGSHLELPGRGTTFVRHVPGAPGAPTVLLLHGWTATADLNFFGCYPALSERYGVIAVDHRGHGKGIRSRRVFRLEDCADDAVAACDELGVERLVVLGYSMGGAVAQLAARRHPERIAGTVLCATSDHFSASRQERRNFLGLAGLAALARLTPAQAQDWLSRQVYLERKTAEWDPWALEQFRGHDWRVLLEAGRALGQFDSRPWLAELRGPVAVVLTMGDQVVSPRRQLEMLKRIPGAIGFQVDADHDAAVANPDRFLPAAQAAIEAVLRR